MDWGSGFLENNNLTLAQVERLAMLAEEASEVAQAAMKIVRFGYADADPRTSVQNIENLIRELADFQATQRLLMRASDIFIGPDWEELVEAAIVKKKRYSLYQR
jgi:hypothetical protein